MSTAFTLSVRDDHIGLITIDVPNESMNVLKAEFAQQIQELLSTIKNNTQLKGLIFISGKNNSFIAGADIKMLDSCTTAKQVEDIGRMGASIFSQLEQLPIPIVAAIHGPALGGGFEFALACHARICTDDPKTIIGLPEVQLGLLPGSGGTQRLAKLIGLQKAIDWIVTGKNIRAKQALKAGAIDQVVPQSILLEAAVKLINKGKIYHKSPKLSLLNQLLENTPQGRRLLFKQAYKQLLAKTKGNYPAPEKILRCIQVGAESGIDVGIDLEAKSFGELCMTPESANLRQLFFATTAMKKETQYQDALPQKLQKIAVLGGGLMGGGIALTTISKAKLPTRIKDIHQEGLRTAFAYSYQQFNKKVKRRFISLTESKKQLGLLSGTTDYTGFKATDLVVEAVFEDLSLKQQMIKEIEQNTNNNTIFASNTSSIPIAHIAAKAERPENVIGLHYFSPVEKMPLVEIIPHAGTSATTIATTIAFARRQGKTPIVVKDCAGFYVNRILAIYMNEAAQLLLTGEPIDNIDRALVQFGFPVGPFQLLDEVGIDVGSKIAPILLKAFGARFQAPDVFTTLIQDGRKGKKNKKGFYQYQQPTRLDIKSLKQLDFSSLLSKRNKKPIDESVYSLLGLSPNAQLTQDTLAERCVLQMLNEAARCLEEKVIANPRDGDIGAIFGIGFPPFLGGPFRYMDNLGIKHIVEKLIACERAFGERYRPCDLLKTMAEEESLFYP